MSEEGAEQGIRVGDRLVSVLTGPLDVFRTVFRRPGLLRVELAFIGFNVGEWATWIAILVFAFDRGGATEAAVLAFAQLVPGAIVAPLASSLGDRFRRDRVLAGCYLAQAVAMSATAVALIAGAPVTLVYPLAILTCLTMTVARPAHGSLLPLLSETPAELTAANVASGSLENLSILVGPTLTGVLLAASGSGAVFAACAVLLTVSAILVARVRLEPEPAHLRPVERGSVAGELAVGFQTVARLAGPRTVVLLLGAGTVVLGALDVLTVVLALDVLDMGDAGVGFLNSALGAGGLVGAALAAGLVGRSRLARPMTAGLIVWGLPMIVIGLLPTPIVAIVLLGLAGAGRAVMDVAARTLLQRVTPHAVMSRVFGVLEGLQMLVLALGSIAVPVLLAILGPRLALVAVGLLMPVACIVLWRRLVTTDRGAHLHLGELGLLRRLPMFAPLGGPTLEWLASNLVPLSVPAGSWIVRQGELGDRFYVVESGEVEVFVDDRSVRVEIAGDSFGEIALLRDVPRTASVQARTDCSLRALERDVFLAAVTGHSRSSNAAADVVAGRLEHAAAQANE